ncbi:MAG: putative membrane protein [Desulfofundulus kuznetsovii]|nr:MAG: putative membrane protein [Desulfofundulus kuznetsovii]
MKKNTFLTIIICLSLCFSIVCSANAATSLTAKQLFLDAIKSTDLSIPEEQKYSMSSGNLNCKIKSFDSILAYEIESLEGIQGSELNIDYKLNTQQRKMEAAYNLLFNQDNYKGYIYLNNNNLILTSDIISQISKVYPDFALTGAEDLPKYIYFNDESLDHMWEGNIFSQNPKLLRYRDQFGVNQGIDD